MDTHILGAFKWGTVDVLYEADFLATINRTGSSEFRLTRGESAALAGVMEEFMRGNDHFMLYIRFGFTVVYMPNRK